MVAVVGQTNGSENSTRAKSGGDNNATYTTPVVVISTNISATSECALECEQKCLILLKSVKIVIRPAESN